MWKQRRTGQGERRDEYLRKNEIKRTYIRNNEINNKYNSIKNKIKYTK